MENVYIVIPAWDDEDLLNPLDEGVRIFRYPWKAVAYLEDLMTNRLADISRPGPPPQLMWSWGWYDGSVRPGMLMNSEEAALFLADHCSPVFLLSLESLEELEKARKQVESIHAHLEGAILCLSLEE